MVTPEEIGQIGVFACLDTADRERVCRAAADINLSAGEFAAHEGDERALFAVLEGQIEATRMVDGIHARRSASATRATSSARYRSRSERSSRSASAPSRRRG